MMLTVVLAAGLVFYEVFVALKTMSDVARMQATMRESMTIVQSTTMPDEEKAVAMQRGSLRLIGAVAMTVGKIFGAVIAGGVVIYLASLFTWPFDEIVRYSVKPLPLIATIGFIAAYGMLRHGRRK